MQRKVSSLWGGKKVALRQTPRAVTPFGGLSVFIEFLKQIGFPEQVQRDLPFCLSSPNAIPAEETFTAFVTSVVAGARRFAHSSMLRADRVLGALLGIKRFPTDGTIRNLFKRFTQEMVVRADAGFFDQGLLAYLEAQGWSYIVVARLTRWLKEEAVQVREWQALGAVYAVGEFRLQLWGWNRARRFVVVRERLRETQGSLGKKLLEVPGYTFRIFVTNRLDPPEEIWRYYNQRACIEQRIEELKSDLAAFLSILMLFNLLAEFQRATGLTGYRQPSSLRVQVFLCGAILGRAGHRTVLHLSSAWGGLEKRNPLFDKLLPYEIPTSRKLRFQPNTAG